MAQLTPEPVDGKLLVNASIFRLYVCIFLSCESVEKVIFVQKLYV
jgi:hypothetical protein